MAVLYRYGRNYDRECLLQERDSAMSSQLTYVSDGKAIIRVDNTTSGAGNSTFGRPSVKLYSSETVSQGSLVVMDATHLPGCAVCILTDLPIPN